MDAKPFWASKTIWANVIAGAAAIAVSFGFDFGLTPDVQAQVLVGVMAVINIVLRFVTKSAVS